MKNKIIVFVLSCFAGWSGLSAQLPTLEFKDGAGNPTGNGPTQNTTIKFQLNTNNPTGNTFTTTPNITANIAVSNQQQPNVAGSYPSVHLGSFLNESDTAPLPDLIFPKMNSIVSSANTNYTVANGATTGTGIDVAVNNGVTLMAYPYQLYVNNQAFYSRHYMADVTITFSHPVKDPVLHFVGMGAHKQSFSWFYTSEYDVDFAASPNVTSIARLSGSSGFNVSASQITKPASFTNIDTGGSVAFIGNNITTIKLKMFLRGSQAGSNSVSNWYDTRGKFFMAEAVNLSVSMKTQIDAVNDAQSIIAGSTGTLSILNNDTLNGNTATTSNVTLTQTSTSNSGVNINTSTGLVTVAAGTPAGTYTINYQICDSISLGICDTATVTVVVADTCGTVDSDGDGIKDGCDLDDDNDGILDTNEGYCSSQSIYTMDLNATLASANSTFNANGGTFNLVYTLTSGTAVSGLGSSFNVPYSYSDFSNLVSSQNHEWEGANIGTTTLSIRPKTNLFYLNLPANNTNTENVSAATPFTPDGKFRYLLNTNRLTKLGTFTTTIGNLPPITGQLSVLSSYTGLNQRSIFNTVSDNGTEDFISNGYYAKMQLQTMANTVNNGSTVFFESSYGQTYTWDYTAFNDGLFAVATNGSDRGLINFAQNTITYCNHRDSDGDGTPDYLDLDSDNDGCPDVIEGGANFQSGSTYITGNRLNTSVDANGVPALPVATPAITGYTQVAGQTVGTSTTVNPIVNAGIATLDQTIASGTAPRPIALEGSSGTVQWQVSTDNSTFTDISGANAANYIPGVLSATTFYKAIVTSVGGCSATSNTVTITVKSTTVSDVACSNNGTFEDATDDYVIFQIDPVATVNHFEGTYQYNLTASFAGSPVTVTQIDGSAATNLYYSTPAYFKIPTSGLGTGNFTLTLTPTWGSYTPQTVSFANPGTCSVACTTSSTGNVVTYYFKAPEYTTDFVNATTNTIPKFNEGTTRKLTKVKVDYGVTFTGGLLIESQNPLPSNITYRSYSDLEFNIAGYNYNATFNIGKNPSYPAQDPFLLGQSSPAVAAWPGTGADTYSVSTMLSHPNTNWLRTTVGLGMDPKADPNWVTNLSGIAAYDDDILLRIYDNVPYNASATFTSATDLANFIGTGSLPNSFSTAANVESISGSSMLTMQRLRGSYYYKVEYTYDCIVDPCTISATNPDSDGDGISDFCDWDDDNDGIKDIEECDTNTLENMAAAFSAGTLLSISPSDFGLPLNARNQNVSKDLSAKFGYPANSGAVIVNITNASVHPSVDTWWTRADQQPSNWLVTGTMSAYVLMAQDNANFYANDSKTIHIYDGSPVVPVNIGPFANQTPVAGQWAVSETATAKILNNLNTDNSTVENAAGWRYANVNFGAKSFGFSTTVAIADPTYEVRMVLECDTDGDGIPDRLDLDSDADNCSDALEGAADIKFGQLVTADSSLTAGSTDVDLNLCAGAACVNSNGVPQYTTLPTGYSNTTGQGVGNAQNALENKCYCTKPATPGTPNGFTKVGITIQKKQEAWPENIPNGHIALESKTKGMVITRVAHVSFVPDLVNDAVKNPFAGMLVYDIQDRCVKLFNGINWKCLERSCNTTAN